MRVRRYIITILLSLSVVIAVRAFTPTEQQTTLIRAISLLEHGRWTDARHEFMRLKEMPGTSDDATLLRRVEYGLTVCAVRLGDGDVEQRMKDFLARYPETVNTNDIRFMLALHYCETEEFDKANAELKKVSYKALNKADRERYDIRMGYTEFLAGRYAIADEYFSRIALTSDYIDHATYYKAYIKYKRGDFDAASSGFASLAKSETYGPVVPYYLLQIEFSRGNYDYVVRHGDELMPTTADAQKVELARMIGESWYRLEGYNKAMQYMNLYRQRGGEMGREENYILGYAMYRNTDYSGAVELLQKVSTGSDALAQNAAYHLADCYIRLGNKRMAIYAFAEASDKHFDEAIAEDALFNYGKLLFETGGGTFNESINVLTRYVNTYPQSERVAEARELLIAAYYNSHDYDLAYSAIKAYDRPDGNIKTALQKITYFSGLESFNEGDYAKARASFEESMAVGVSPKYNALCAFWLGEIAYNEGNYAKALEQYNFYLKRAPKSADEYKMALYNVGYSQIALDNMPAAAKAMEGFLWLYKNPDNYRADAYNRLGDARYAQRDFEAAVKGYEGAMAIGTSEQHYARYQRAIALGLLNRTNPKIDALRQIISDARGEYVDDASYELGRTFVSLERYGEGARVLETFVANYPSSPFYTPALLDLGLIYLNLGDTDRSLEFYDKVITAAPQSSAARDAILSVREIYVARGNVDAYFDYASRTGVECDMSVMARDSLSFRAAQKTYMSGRTAEAIAQLEHYVYTFPKGYYLNDALYCLGDSFLKCDSLDSAIAVMQRLAEAPTNRYTVSNLERLSQVAYDNRIFDVAASAYRNLYDAADTASRRTEASTGYITSTLACGGDDRILSMVDDVDSLSYVAESPLRKARFAKARILYGRGETAVAIPIFESLAGNVADIEGAESAFRVIKERFDEARFDECEQLVYAFADRRTPHAYWLGKAFIVLGDVYVKRGDQFQARATYRSIVDGYSPSDDGIVDEARERIQKLD